MQERVRRLEKRVRQQDAVEAALRGELRRVLAGEGLSPSPAPAARQLQRSRPLVAGDPPPDPPLPVQPQGRPESSRPQMQQLRLPEPANAAVAHVGSWFQPQLGASSGDGPSEGQLSAST